MPSPWASTLARHSDDVPADQHLRDGGHYRFRRHASLRLTEDGRPTPEGAGASPASLAAQVLRPVALSTSIAAAVGAIALSPLVRYSPVLSELLLTTPTRVFGAIGSVVLLLMTVALLRLARVLGNRRLASELQAQ